MVYNLLYFKNENEFGGGKVIITKLKNNTYDNFEFEIKTSTKNFENSKYTQIYSLCRGISDKFPTTDHISSILGANYCIIPEDMSKYIDLKFQYK